MKEIPVTKHATVTYRNGEKGLLIMSNRKGTAFSVLTVREKDHSVIHHYENGSILVNGEHGLDIMKVEQ